MAEIPVERKSGGLPWWLLPLIGLLILLPLLWFLLRGCGPAAVVDNTNGNANRSATANNNANRMMSGNQNSGGMTANTGGATATAGNANGSTISVSDKGTATGARVTDVNLFGSTADKKSLAGRGVELSSVKVNRVVSDKIFTVTSGTGEMFVMLDDALDSAGGKESQIKMRPGQTVNVGGEFRDVPTPETENEKQNADLKTKDYGQMKGQQIYLHATSVADSK